jgi:hypothetical protein
MSQSNAGEAAAVTTAGFRVGVSVKFRKFVGSIARIRWTRFRVRSIRGVKYSIGRHCCCRRRRIRSCKSSCKRKSWSRSSHRARNSRKKGHKSRSKRNRRYWRKPLPVIGNFSVVEAISGCVKANAGEVTARGRAGEVSGAAAIVLREARTGCLEHS